MGRAVPIQPGQPQGAGRAVPIQPGQPQGPGRATPPQQPRGQGGQGGQGGQVPGRAAAAIPAQPAASDDAVAGGDKAGKRNPLKEIKEQTRERIAHARKSASRELTDTQAGYDNLAWWTGSEDDDGHDPFPGR